MAYKVRLSRRAIADLEAIYDEKNVRQSAPAEAWYLGLRDAVFSLEDLPHRGLLAWDRPSLRQLLYGTRPHTYRILYTVDDAAAVVSVAQIRHSARKPLKIT
jgi:toxin ParE1/3/4